MDEKTIKKKTTDYVNEMKSALDSLTETEGIELAIYVLLEAYEKGNNVIAFGNGGSGCLAAHLIQDLAKHTIISDDKSKVVNYKRFRALCLNESVSTMTTWANDVGYEKVFSEQLLNWVRLGDVVIGITGSGNTPNIIEALKAANSKGATTIALTGGGRVVDLAKISIVVKSKINYCIEDALSSAVHIITDAIRDEIQR
jgi:D-sedoheptulose 7-phosphate isomerase